MAGPGEEDEDQWWLSQGHISSRPQKELPPEVVTDFLELEGMSRGLGLLGGPVDRVQAQMTSEGLCHPRVLSVCPFGTQVLIYTLRSLWFDEAKIPIGRVGVFHSFSRYLVSTCPVPGPMLAWMALGSWLSEETYRPE